MPAAPFLTAALLIASAVLRAIGLALDGDPFAGESAALLAMTLVVHALIATIGLLVARSRWARWHAVGVVGASLAVGLIVELEAWSLAASLAAGGALAGLAGPWLRRGWLRHLPAAEGPPPEAVGVMIGLLALPGAVAVSVPSGPGTWSWIMVAVSAAATLGLSRALVAALWMTRLIVPAFGIVAGLTEGLPGGPVIAVAALAVAGPAWRRTVALSIAPLVPLREAAVPMPPELMDPSLLEAAGYDDRGKPLEAP